MGVATIYKAYVSGLCKEIYPQKYGQKYGTNVPPFQDPGIPIETTMENHHGLEVRHLYMVDFPQGTWWFP